MVVSAGEKRRPRRRTERRGVEIVVAKSIVGDAIEGRSRNRAAEGAGRAETDVVRHDQSTFGAPSGALTALGKSGFDSLAFRPITP